MNETALSARVFGVLADLPPFRLVVVVAAVGVVALVWRREFSALSFAFSSFVVFVVVAVVVTLVVVGFAVLHCCYCHCCSCHHRRLPHCYYRLWSHE